MIGLVGVQTPSNNRRRRMPSDNVGLPQTNMETKLRVGWQQLTKQEFVEALTVAVLDKVRDHRQKRSRVPVFSVESSQIGFSDFRNQPSNC